MIRRLLRSWALWMLVLLAWGLMILLATGCAGARVTPASNTAQSTQTQTGPTERTRITIGGSNAQVPDGERPEGAGDSDGDRGGLPDRRRVPFRD